MEAAFRRVMEHIFNNWTALKLAVDHSMAGTDSKKIALDFMNYMVQFCLNDFNGNVESIQDALDDIMDEEFETICEDGSTKEISIILNKFLTLIKDENYIIFEEEFQKLPTCNEWLIKTQSKTIEVSEEASGNGESSVNDEHEAMELEQDPEWTQVKSRRKR